MIAEFPRWLMLAACLWFCMPVSRAIADVSVPALVTHVTDTTSTLSELQKSALEDKLLALEKRKGAQLLILIVPSTEPEAIEQYATRVFDAWKVGRKKTDDGVLLVWAKNDRRIRIEVGYGLEGPIPDALANRIITETMRPLFRNEAWFEGLDKASDQLIGLIDGEALPEPPPTSANNSDQSSGDFVDRYFQILFLIPIVVLVATFWPRGREFSASLSGAGIATAVAFKMFDLSLQSLPLVGLVYFLFGLAYAFNLFPSSGSIGRGAGGGGWSGGSGGWGSGGGGGSWGGGGGRSGGGGASGSY